MDAVDFTEPTSEEQRVLEWKLDQLQRLGFEPSDAMYLAVSPDNDVLAVARKLVAHGCDTQTALMILA